MNETMCSGDLVKCRVVDGEEVTTEPVKNDNKILWWIAIAAALLLATKSK